MLTPYLLQSVKNEFVDLDIEILLQSRIDVLKSVDDPLVEIFDRWEIHNVFELAVSKIFNVAREIVEAAKQPNSAIAKLGIIPAEYVKDKVLERYSLLELQEMPIEEVIAGIGSTPTSLLTAIPELGTVRGLALWEPFQAARQILNLAFGVSQEVVVDDPDAPAELLPTAGEYATEKVYYSSIFLDEVEVEEELVDISSPVDLLPLYNSEGFAKPATGAILTFEQAWFPQGLSLGQLLHSIALAPAESTRIAIIDWSRQSSTNVGESITQAEKLDNTLVQNRAISETVEAVATEAQSGFSKVSSRSKSSTAGIGLGFSFAGSSRGFSGGRSKNRSTTTTVSSSRGRRSITGETLQDINQSTQQNATSVRTRRASIVREVSQSEQERLQTRMITNYNHSHALSIHYYEVVQIYRVITCLVKCERCIFIPMKPLNFEDSRLIDRYRSLLYDGAHSATVRDLLLSSQEDMVVFRQQLAPYKPLPNSEELRWTQRSRARLTKLELLGNAQRRVTKVRIHFLSTETPLELSATNPVISIDSETIQVADIEKIAIDYTDSSILTRSRPQNQINRSVGGMSGSSDDTNSEEIDDIFPDDGGSGDSQNPPSDRSDIVADSLRVRFSFAEDYPGQERISFTTTFRLEDAEGSDLVLLDTLPVPGDRTLGFLLNEEASYYSQLIWQNLDAQSVALLLSRYNFKGKRLVEYIDPQPLTTYGNYLVLRYNFDEDTNVQDSQSSELQDWQAWKARHVDFNKKITQEIPIGTGGTFAEAVLGRYNASEKLDITRFWDWQTSPIPQQAPEIAPLSAGSRAIAEKLTPGELDTPVVNIMNPPSLPEPQGMTAAMSAITTANLFRDMSGLSEAIQLALQGLVSASDSAVASGAQAGENLKVAAELEKARLEVAAKILPMLMGGAIGGLGGAIGGGNISHTGALLNHGAKLDRENRSSNGATSGGGNDGGVSGTGEGAATPGKSLQSTSYEANTFKNALNLLYGVVDALDPLLAEGGRGFEDPSNTNLMDEDEA